MQCEFCDKKSIILDIYRAHLDYTGCVCIVSSVLRVHSPTYLQRSPWFTQRSELCSCRTWPYTFAEFIRFTRPSAMRKLKSNYAEHIRHKSIHDALQLSLHMTTLICKTKQSRSIKNGVRQVMKIDHTYKYPSNMATFRNLFFTKKLNCVTEITKQCIANERTDAYLIYSTKNLSSNKNEIRHGCCGAHLIKFGITLTLPTESTIFTQPQWKVSHFKTFHIPIIG